MRTPLLLRILPAVLLVMVVHDVEAFFLPGRSQLHRKSQLSAESSSSKRVPWNFFRFLQQSSKFVSILPSSGSAKRRIDPGTVLWEATSSSSSSGFSLSPLDDVVMGGASASSFSRGRWKGLVTDANNGGFVGIRSTPSFEYDMTKCQGIEITLRSGGTATKRFKLGLRDSKDFNGIVWTFSFDAPGNYKAKMIQVPFAKLVPTLFARTIPNPPRFRRDNVVGIQLVYSKFEYDGAMNPNFQLGDVDVEIESIKAY